MKKRYLIFGMVFSLYLGLMGFTLAANMKKGIFTDILPNDAGAVWYDYESILICEKAGLMKGNNNLFNPAGTFSAAETAVITARFYAQMTGQPLSEPISEEAWYEPAMSVAAKTGAINFLGVDPLAPITRKDFVHAVATGISLFEMPILNDITVLPDTSDKIILMFYNAGIITGVDDIGTFNGAGYLTRAEAAVIISRILEQTKRTTFTPACSNDELLSLLLAKELTEHPKRYIVVGDKNLQELSSEEIEHIISMSGVSADEIMLRIGGVTIAAKQYFPLLISNMQRFETALGDYYESTVFVQLEIDGSVYDWADGIKRQVLNDCVDYILFLLENNITPTIQDRAAYLADHTAVETNTLKNLDINLLYESVRESQRQERQDLLKDKGTVLLS